MARPRLIRLGVNSEIKLTNVPNDIADKVKALVTSSETTESEAAEEVAPNFTNTSVGIFQDKDKLWYVACVKFDPLTGQGKVDKVIKAGLEKSEAVERFKVLSVQEGIVA